MLGALFMIAGFGLAAAAALELGTNLSPLPRPRRHGVLVRTGVYARARHPIYGGIIIAALGWALWRTSGVHLLLAGAAAPYLYAKTLREEAFLRQRYPDYDAYRAHTKHLIPGIF
jgi:protein-S-isoprenylcysteine O-methyltransferase Ste14